MVKTEIKLSKANANDGTEPGSDGEDGIPGNPGKPGGNFKLNSSNWSSKGTLYIDVRGGDGGIGQNGGNGADGLDGMDANPEHVHNRDIEKWQIEKSNYGYSQKSTKGKVIHVAKFIATYNGQVLEKIRCEGEPGQKGGDAGRGGWGGKGGNSGTIFINWDINATKVTGEGNQGINGIHGIPGKGGKQGKSWYGEYLGEYIFPGLRGKANNYETNDTDTTICATDVSDDSEVPATAETEEVPEPPMKDSKKTKKKRKVKQITKQVAKTATKITVKQTIKQTAKQAIKQSVQTMAKSGADVATETAATSSAAAASTGWTALTFGAGVAVSLAAQVGISAVSANLSSGWKVKPTIVENEETKTEDGDIPSDYNEDGMQQPLENQALVLDSIEFQTYLATFRKEFTCIIDEDKAQKWFK